MLKDASPNVSLSWKLVLSAIVAALGSFNFGYNISVINTPGNIFLGCSSGRDAGWLGSGVFHWDCFFIDPYKWGWIVGVMPIGALVGSLATGSIANKSGRLAALYFSSMLHIIGYAVMGLASNSFALLLGRFATGVGSGAACIVVPLYLTEISPTNLRGRIASAHQMAIVLGILFVEVLGYSGLARPFYWRVMFGLGLVSCVFQLVPMLFGALPESPRYLQIKGRNGEALSVQRSLGQEEPLMSPQAPPMQSWSFMQLLKNWRLAGRSLAVAVVLHLAQQLSGINVVFYFSNMLFSKPGESSSVVPTLISFLNVVLTIVAVGAIDHAGRRLLAIVSAAGMVLSGTALTACFLLGLQKLSIVLILLYVATFAFGLGPVPWLMMNELFPTEVAAVGVSIAVGVNWLTNTFVGASFPWLHDLLGRWIFAPYTFFTFLFLLFSIFILPETNGRHLSFL